MHSTSPPRPGACRDPRHDCVAVLRIACPRVTCRPARSTGSPASGPLGGRFVPARTSRMGRPENRISVTPIHCARSPANSTPWTAPRRGRPSDRISVTLIPLCCLVHVFRPFSRTLPAQYPYVISGRRVPPARGRGEPPQVVACKCIAGGAGPDRWGAMRYRHILKASGRLGGRFSRREPEKRVAQNRISVTLIPLCCLVLVFGREYAVVV